jgi:hypothetical protein
MEVGVSNPAVIVISALAAIGAVFAVGKWVGAVNSDRTSLGEFIKEIREDIKKILGRLPPVPVTGASPRTLTDLGRSISIRINAPALAQKLAPELMETLKNKQPYEIQEACFDYVGENVLTAEHLADFKACAYENGIEIKGVLDVLAVELRDEILSKIQQP